MKTYNFNTLDSTNSEARRMINAGAAGDFALLAAEQTGGRGQFDRRFFSPPTGLYLSVALLLSGGRPNNSFVTQAAALAVSEALEEVLGISLKIKPVNDLIYSGRKVGGILVESVTSPMNGRNFLIFGVGLNLYPPKGGFPPEISDSAGHIFEDEIDKTALISAIIEKIKKYSTGSCEDLILARYLERAVEFKR